MFDVEVHLTPNTSVSSGAESSMKRRLESQDNETHLVSDDWAFGCLYTLTQEEAYGKQECREANECRVHMPSSDPK